MYQLRVAFMIVTIYSLSGGLQTTTVVFMIIKYLKIFWSNKHFCLSVNQRYCFFVCVGFSQRNAGSESAGLCESHRAAEQRSGGCLGTRPASQGAQDSHPGQLFIY